MHRADEHRYQQGNVNRLAAGTPDPIGCPPRQESFLRRIASPELLAPQREAAAILTGAVIAVFLPLCFAAGSWA